MKKTQKKHLSFRVQRHATTLANIVSNFFFLSFQHALAGGPAPPPRTRLFIEQLALFFTQGGGGGGGNGGEDNSYLAALPLVAAPRDSAVCSGHAASFWTSLPYVLVDLDAASSRCICLVSGTKAVKHIPTRLTMARAMRETRVPNFNCRAPKPNAPGRFYFFVFFFNESEFFFLFFVLLESLSSLPPSYSPTTAPSLPVAAENPCRVERNLVAKTSAGRMN